MVRTAVPYTPSVEQVVFDIGSRAEDEFGGAPLMSIFLRDGGALLVDSKDQQIRRVNETGRVLWRVGKGGSGPGEFRDVSAVYETANGDVLVIDELLSRLTRLNTRGEYLASVSVAPPAGRALRVLGVDAAGALVAVQKPVARPSRDRIRLAVDSLHLWRRAARGTAWTRFATIPLGRALFIEDTRGWRTMPLFLGNTLAQLCGADVVVYSAHGITRIDPQGRAQSAAEPPGLRVPVADGIDQLIGRYLPSLHDDGLRRSVVTALNSIDGLTVASSQLIVPDRTGRVWMRSQAPSARGVLELWEGDTLRAMLQTRTPRFTIDAFGDRLMAVVPESDSALSRVVVVSPERGTATARENDRVMLCGRAMRVDDL